VLKF
jgi:hypothetical protein